MALAIRIQTDSTGEQAISANRMNEATDTSVGHQTDPFHYSSEEKNKYVLHQVGNFVEYYATLFISLTTFCLLYKYAHSLAFITGINCWGAFYFQRTIRLIYNIYKGRERGGKCHAARIIVSNILLITTGLLLTFYCLNIGSFNAFTVCSPLLLSYVLSYLCFLENSNFCYSLVQWLKVGASLFRLLTVFMLLLKFENRITTFWATTLW